jgi:rhodanese-related sulfurtransferase
MTFRVIWQDLTVAGLILVLAGMFGLWQQWPSVNASFRGQLAAYLEEARNQRRETFYKGIPTVSLPQVHELFQQKEALFIDARPTEEYAELHISGAINLPPDQLEKEGPQRLAGTPKGERIVVYCSQASCEASLKAAQKLRSMGYTQVVVFLGGFRAWDEAGYPVSINQ